MQNLVTNQNMRQGMSQNMRLNQFQQHSLQVLQRNAVELLAEVEEFQVEHPEMQWKDGKIPEWQQGDDIVQPRRRYPGEWHLENQWQNGRFLSAGQQNSDAKQQMLENFSTEQEGPDLRETLREQIYAWQLPEEDKEFCELVLQNLDESGLNIENPILVSNVLFPRGRSKRHLLGQIQQLEPPGCACDSPLHSLIVQAGLRFAGSLLVKVLESLPSLEVLGSLEDFLEYIRRQEGVSEEEALVLLEDLRSLEPYPARGYQVYKSNQSFRIYPEVQVHCREESDEIEIQLLNQLGARLVITEGKPSAEARHRRQEAQALLDQLQRREETLLQIAESIFRQQSHFVREGLAGLQVMNLQMIAEQIHLHPSTISRCIQGKYCKTPWGTYPLRFFFTQGAGSGQSREQIKERIIEILKDFQLGNNGSVQKLSDMGLAKRLEKLGIQVARRTVAKYRSELKNEGRLYCT